MTDGNQAEQERKMVEDINSSNIPDDDFWHTILNHLAKEPSSNTDSELKELLPEVNNNEAKKSSSETTDSLDKLHQKLAAILKTRLPEKKAMQFIEQLRDCSSEVELKSKTQDISKKITLMVNASVGKELLQALDS